MIPYRQDPEHIAPANQAAQRAECEAVAGHIGQAWRQVKGHGFSRADVRRD